jgi:hypothetical protein
MPDQLWTPPARVAQLRHRPKQRTVTLPSGERAKVTVDDTATVIHIERAERLDAVVRPDVIRLKIQRFWSATTSPVRDEIPKGAIAPELERRWREQGRRATRRT